MGIHVKTKDPHNWLWRMRYKTMLTLREASRQIGINPGLLCQCEKDDRVKTLPDHLIPNVAKTYGAPEEEVARNVKIDRVVMEFNKAIKLVDPSIAKDVMTRVMPRIESLRKIK